ncbi:MAG: phosphate signaling complex protein PhoU [Spirochaetes bacterium]|nr:phosphate signaling complex protein PhoU [Spirochaetota bacterium]
MLNEKLIQLKESVIHEATMVEEMIRKSIKGLIEKDKKNLEEVIKKQEGRVNKAEIDIDEKCINLIALYQPEARDLRTILMILKMNNDLERMGDQAVNISESALFLIEKPFIKPFIDIPRMAEEASNMLKDSITSFINEDVKLAQDVVKRDNIVDNLQTQIIRELVTFMISDTTTIERCLHIIRISHNIERIADLSTNICEDTIFMVSGKNIKHFKKKDNK